MLTIPTDHDELQWILNMTDATGNCRHGTYDYQTLTSKLSTGVASNIRQPNALSRLLKTGMDVSPLEDDVQVLMMTRIAEANPEREIPKRTQTIGIASSVKMELTP